MRASKVLLSDCSLTRAGWPIRSTRNPSSPSFSARRSIAALVGAQTNTCRSVWSATVIALTSGVVRSEEHTSELQSRENLVCRLLLEKKKKKPVAVTNLQMYFELQT